MELGTRTDRQHLPAPLTSVRSYIKDHALARLRVAGCERASQQPKLAVDFHVRIVVAKRIVNIELAQAIQQVCVRNAIAEAAYGSFETTCSDPTHGVSFDAKFRCRVLRARPLPAQS